MEELILAVSRQTGLDPMLVRQGILALAGVIRKRVGEETFMQIAATVPGGAELLSKPAPAAAPASGGGFMGGLLGSLGGMMGGKAGLAAEAAGALQDAGIDLNQATPFATAFFESATALFPPETVAMIHAKIPEIEELLEQKNSSDPGV